MDEKPKCSQEVEPITQQPTKKKKENGQSEDQKQLILSEEQSPATKTVLTKDQPAYSEDQLDAVKILTVLTIDQPIYSPEQPILSINQPVYSPEQPVCSPNQIFSTEQPAISTDQPKHSTEKPIHSTEQPEFSKEKSVFSEDQSALPNTQKDHPVISTEQSIFLKEKPGYSKDQSNSFESVLTIDQPVYRPDLPVYTPDVPAYLEDDSIYSIDQLAYSEDKSTFSNSQTTLSPVQLNHSTNQPGFTQQQPAYSKHQPAAYSKDESAFTRKNKSFSPEEQTSLSTIHIDPAINISSSSRELLITSKIEVASTKYVSVFPKNDVASLIRNSKNIEYEISLCAAKAASVTSYNLINNGYFLSANAPLKINISTQSPSISDPMTVLPVPRSIAVAIGTQPPSLFLQALSKLNESSLTLAVLSHFRLQSPSNLSRSYTFQSGDITPPDSLTSAPPTYSFVLRQIAIRRRPRFMGSFFTSPSFVQHTPPPTYNGAFDLYVEPALPPPPTRHYSLGYNSMPVVCPECGFTGMTIIRSRITICTHCCAFLLCILCCWICAPLPYILTSCKDVYHYCRNCRTFLGMYCPSNPDASNVYPTDCNR